MLDACAEYWPLILAALIGLLTAWWIWGGRTEAAAPKAKAVKADPPAAPKVTAGTAAAAGTAAGAAALMSKPKVKKAPVKKAPVKKAVAKKTPAKKTVAKKPAAKKKAPAKPKAKAAATKAKKAPAKKAAPKAKTAAVKPKPKTRAKPRAAKKPKVVIPDDLELLKGVGPKLNKLLKSLGVTSFEQVANWSAAEIRDVDSNLGAFAGRIGRDNWVDQAKLLVKGDVRAFEKKYGSLGSEIKR